MVGSHPLFTDLSKMLTLSGLCVCMQLVLSSVHAVKGLECVVCFVVGLDTRAWRYLPCPISATDIQQASHMHLYWAYCSNTSMSEEAVAMLNSEGLLPRPCSLVSCALCIHAITNVYAHFEKTVAMSSLQWANGCTVGANWSVDMCSQ